MERPAHELAKGEEPGLCAGVSGEPGPTSRTPSEFSWTRQQSPSPLETVRVESFSDDRPNSAKPEDIRTNSLLRAFTRHPLERTMKDANVPA